VTSSELARVLDPDSSTLLPLPAFAQLDDILDGLARDADHRLAYQASHTVSP
jgi:hypothetical protein